MKKNILIIILTIIAIAALGLYTQQKQRADHFQNLAEVHAREIQEMKNRIEISRKRAEQAKEIMIKSSEQIRKRVEQKVKASRKNHFD